MASKIKRTFHIHSQLVYDRDSQGKRYPHGQVRWGKVVTWNGADNATNFREAVLNAVGHMNNNKLGTVISVRQYNNGIPTRNVTKLFVAKWGHDNRPFTKFYYSIGDWWKRKAGL